MPLATGTRLGPYEIVALIGKGGMGEVYRARDTRLGRDVAIKVSADKFSERFEREARAIASLNHPNICQLYDVGENYLVMELIEGVPLKGPLPLEKTMEYAGQILDALDAAHQKGITHRDLKPDNILVTKQGIKLLDFGLAKQRSSALKESDETLTEALTSQGQPSGPGNICRPSSCRGRKPTPTRSGCFTKAPPAAIPGPELWRQESCR
jgi:serine/threonine protein kinase